MPILGRPPNQTAAKARERLAIAQAVKTELQTAVIAGELVKAADVERAWFAALRNLRARLLAIPSRLTVFTAETVDREIRAALNELGKDEL